MPAEGPIAKKRVFIGIPLDQRCQRCINQLLRPLKNSGRGIRWVPEINRHMTLAFLGDKPAAEIENLLNGFDEAYRHAASFQFGLSTLARFPNARGRIIALLDEPSKPLGELYRLTLGLLQAGHVKFDRRAFRPHVTLARIRKTGQLDTAFAQQTNVRLDIDRLRFYQSTLTESGPVYTPLKEVWLK